MVDLNEPTTFAELRSAFLQADQIELNDYTANAEQGNTEDRVTLLEKRLFVMGVIITKLLSLLAEKEHVTIN